jgi:ATP-dependent HslUV protease subunit HslV
MPSRPKAFAQTIIKQKYRSRVSCHCAATLALVMGGNKQAACDTCARVPYRDQHREGDPMSQNEFPGWHGTTIIGVKKDGRVVVAGDGQVSLGQTVIKGSARKVRRLSPGGFEVVAGFAGSTADAFTLLERLEAKLEATPGQLARASVELAKDWRTDKYLQKLEAMLIVTDGKDMFVITGAGDVLEPEHDVAAIGSGGNYALAAARAMMDSDKDAETVARDAMAIAADICVYTNGNLTVESIDG